jgi:serine/threonine protein kinase/Tol biopolymer transport system component
MSESDRWQRIKAIFDAAVVCRAEDRQALLHELCGGDRSLQADVESLLNADTARGSIFEHTINDRLRGHVIEAVADVLDRRGQTLLSGEHLGSYEIIGFLGAGGMGRVYRARDTTLGRDVALKILPDLWLADPDRQARFEREARLLASLNHPNIASIYGVHESVASTGGLPVKALVLELVEGDTLADHIATQAVSTTPRRGLPIDDVVRIARQVIDALEAAHERGIVHRDLKPANIKITPEGRVKVLDFGLARASSVGHRSEVAESPTMTVGGTQDGVLLGTAPYMSPEQARGRIVDRRADIWAFGCVLYEMLTGEAAFKGDDVADVLANLIKADPDWSALPADTPASLRLCLHRCLQKDLKQRLHDSADVRLVIEGAFDQPLSEQEKTLRERRWRAPLAYGSALVAVLALLALAFAPRNTAELLETRLEIVTPPAEDPLSLAIAPDGRSVVFQAGEDPPRLWLRTLDAQDARPLAGTEGGRMPFWSPDGRSIGFTATGALKRIDLGSGLVRTLASRASIGASWNNDGTILMGSGIGPLFVVPAEGGTAKPVTDLLPGQVTHRWPQFLPDGRRFLLFAMGVPDKRGVYAGSLESARVRRVSDRESGYQILPSHLLFARQGALLARRASSDFTSLEPGFLPVAPNVLVDRGLFGFAAFSSSSNGSIAYRASAGETQLVWLDRTGRAVGTVGPPDDTQLLLSHLSHDGRSVAVTRTIAGNTNVWLLDTERGVPRRLTYGLNDTSIVFSPDGTRIAHQAEGDQEGTVVWERRADGTGGETVLLDEPDESEFDHPRDWSGDGRYILYSVSTRSNLDLRALPLFGDRKPIEIARTPFDEDRGRFSPDGRWVAYQSDETGRTEIHVQPFPGPGPKFQVSVGGGTLPRWSRDGRELFYVAPDRKLMTVAVTPRSTTLETGAPRALFTLSTTSFYEPSPDGQRFLVTAVVSEPSPITIIMNWQPK